MDLEHTDYEVDLFFIMLFYYSDLVFYSSSLFFSSFWL